MTESLRSSPEIIAALLIGSTPTQKVKMKKKKEYINILKKVNKNVCSMTYS